MVQQYNVNIEPTEFADTLVMTRVRMTLRFIQRNWKDEVAIN